MAAAEAMEKNAEKAFGKIGQGAFITRRQAIMMQQANQPMRTRAAARSWLKKSMVPISHPMNVNKVRNSLLKALQSGNINPRQEAKIMQNYKNNLGPQLEKFRRMKLEANAANAKALKAAQQRAANIQAAENKAMKEAAAERSNGARRAKNAVAARRTANEARAAAEKKAAAAEKRAARVADIKAAVGKRTAAVGEAWKAKKTKMSEAKAAANAKAVASNEAIFARLGNQYYTTLNNNKLMTAKLLLGNYNKLHPLQMRSKNNQRIQNLRSKVKIYEAAANAAAKKAAAERKAANNAVERKAANTRAANAKAVKAAANARTAEERKAANAKAAANAEKKAPNALKNYLVATVKPQYNKALVNAILKLPDINNNTRRRLQAPRMYALQRGAGALGRGAVTAGGALGRGSRGVGGFFSRLFAPKPVGATEPPSFIPFKQGMKIPLGYVLKTNTKGTGYYMNQNNKALASQLEHRGYGPAPNPPGTTTGVSIGVGPSRYRNNYGYGNRYGNRYGNNRRDPGGPGIVFAPKINVGAARIGAQTFGGTRVGGQTMGGSRATTGNVGGTRVTTGNAGRLAVSAPTTNGNRQLAATPEQLIRGAGGAEAV
jgi:membrane protein involved in colicin uptake